jgi:biofilm protein TabA
MRRYSNHSKIEYTFKKGFDMILDILENAHHYLTLHDGFAKAFDFLLRPDLKTLPVGKYEIDADHVYAIVSRQNGRRKEDALLETHEKYIDIQLVLAGTDEMGWKPKSLCKKPAGEYDQKNDEQIFMDEPDTWISTQNGAFVIFFPADAHMPLISLEQIHKVVVKIAVVP